MHCIHALHSYITFHKIIIYVNFEHYHFQTFQLLFFNICLTSFSNEFSFLNFSFSSFCFRKIFHDSIKNFSKFNFSILL